MTNLQFHDEVWPTYNCLNVKYIAYKFGYFVIHSNLAEKLPDCPITDIDKSITTSQLFTMTSHMLNVNPHKMILLPIMLALCLQVPIMLKIMLV